MSAPKPNRCSLNATIADPVPVQLITSNITPGINPIAIKRLLPSPEFRETIRTRSPTFVSAKEIVDNSLSELFAISDLSSLLIF